MITVTYCVNLCSGLVKLLPSSYTIRVSSWGMCGHSVRGLYGGVWLCAEYFSPTTPLGKKGKTALRFEAGLGGWVGECDMRLDIPLEGDCSGATCDTERWPNTTN